MSKRAFGRTSHLKNTQNADKRTHLIEIDALRGLAILSVVGTHLAGQWKHVPDVSGGASQLPFTVPILDVDALDLIFFGGLGFAPVSSLGIYLFWLLSGYLLIGIEDQRMRRGTYSVRSYARRRALRILPAFYVAILAILVLFRDTVSVEYVLLHLSFLYPILNPITTGALHTYWYLSVEMFNYLLLPFVVAMLPRWRQRLALLGLLFVLSLGIQIYLIQNGLGIEYLDSRMPNLWFLSVVPTSLYLFIAGGLLRMMIERLDSQIEWRWRPLVASVLLLASVSLYISPLLFVNHPSINILLGHGELIVIIFFASVMLGTPLLRGLLRWKPLVFIGVISYSIYLLESTMMGVMVGHILPHVRDWTTSEGTSLAAWAGFSAYALGILIPVFIVSYVSYRYVESPFLQRKPS